MHLLFSRRSEKDAQDMKESDMLKIQIKPRKIRNMENVNNPTALNAQSFIILTGGTGFGSNHIFYLQVEGSSKNDRLKKRKLVIEEDVVSW